MLPTPGHPGAPPGGSLSPERLQPPGSPERSWAAGPRGPWDAGCLGPSVCLCHLPLLGAPAAEHIDTQSPGTGADSLARRVAATAQVAWGSCPSCSEVLSAGPGTPELRGLRQFPVTSPLIGFSCLAPQFLPPSGLAQGPRPHLPLHYVVPSDTGGAGRGGWEGTGGSPVQEVLPGWE